MLTEEHASAHDSSPFRVRPFLFYQQDQDHLLILVLV
jgi:hypothetical protein